jgi:hypothetical protein
MYKRLSFAGVSVPESGARPSAYDEMLERHGRTDIGGFDQLLQTLDEQYSIEDRPAMYGSNTDDGVLPATNHKVLVNPAWEGEDEADIPGDRVDAVWNIPKSGYATVSHDDPLRQLREAVGERYDSSDVFGTTRLRRTGAESHTDLFTHADTMDGLDSGDDLYLGISTGHDYTSTTRLYVDVVALLVPEDGTARILRYLIDPRKRKHTGDAEDEVVAWYGDALDRLDKVSDKLYRVIGDAMNYEVDMGEYPCSVTQFYSHLGLPDNRNDLATPASKQLALIKPTGEHPTAWHFYKAGMAAIESEYDSRDTSAYKNHVSTVNTLLFNPSLAEKRVLSSVESAIVEARGTDDDTEPTDITSWTAGEEGDPLESVRTRAKSISEGVAEFESTRERVRALLNDEGTEEAEVDEEETLTRVEADD